MKSAVAFLCGWMAATLAIVVIGVSGVIHDRQRYGK